jgi:hypothetical protein
MFAAVLVVSVLSQTSQPVIAAAAPIDQCNGVGEGGGKGVACTVVIDNYVTIVGGVATPTQPSTVTLIVCLADAGPIRAGSTATCVTTPATLSPDPITVVDQCNGSANGGGGVLICRVFVNNHFTGTPPSGLTPATVFQCNLSAATSAPPICSPGNTAPNATAATVGHCNDSANNGGALLACNVTSGSQTSSALNAHVAQCNDTANQGGADVLCTATTAAFNITVRQCNNSANQGGAFVRCTTLINNIITVAATATPTAQPTVLPTTQPTAAATANPTVIPTQTPPTATVPPAIVAAVNETAAKVGQPTAGSPAVPSSDTTTPASVAPVQAPAAPAAPAAAAGGPGSGIPSGSTTAPPAAPSAPTTGLTTTTVRPPNTGNAGLAGGSGAPRTMAWLLSLAGVALVLGTRGLVSGRKHR